MPLKFFHRLIIIPFLLFFSQKGMAQYAIWKAGVGLQSENIFSSKWKENITAPGVNGEFNSPNLNWGWGWNISSDYLVMDGLAVGLRYGQTYYSGSADNSTFTAEANARFNDISIYGDFYLLKFFRNYFLPHVQESFYVRVAPTYHTSSLTYTDTSAVNMEVKETTSGFGLNLGVGYTQYVTDKISISGMLNSHFSGSSGSYENSNGETVSNSYFMTRLSAEVKVAYTIKQKKQLCPIKTCSVQQEHTHAVLGGAVVRGNSYKYRQNQKYGDVHRGQVEKSKRKKTKSERQQQKLQRKEKRNRKRLRIIGAGH